MSVLLTKLYSLTNLGSAWRRITTAGNLQYKKFFRDIYYAYEIAATANIGDLQTRLKSGTYQPSAPARVFLPKPSGLQRPITLLSLEDQIVWQAVANVFAVKLRQRRKEIELKTVFSNILPRQQDDIFFVRDWHISYAHFQKRVTRYYEEGFRWVAYFDLAAFYETICHDLLMRVVCPRGGEEEFRMMVTHWLEVWSANTPTLSHRHGIPQGPAASDFLAECFLLPVDEALTDGFRYARYGDDIRLFARTHAEIRKAAVQLEVLCRDRGLIPQAKKYGIKKVRSLTEAMGSLPSIAPSDESPSAFAVTLPPRASLPMFRQALNAQHTRIVDKSRARYVLYRAQPCYQLTQYVCKFLLLHPEHIDVFIHYINRCKPSARITRACTEKLKKTPYEYIQGELWHVLSHMLDTSGKKRLLNRAIKAARNKNASLALKWGACHFLCKAESDGLGRYSRFVQYQDSALLQALLVPALPDAAYAEGDVVGTLIMRSAFEPGIMLAEQFIKRGLTHRTLGYPTRRLPDQVKNVFRAFGIIRGRKQAIDPIGEILSKRYEVAKWTKWKKVFGNDYVHALQILSRADSVFKSGRSAWLRMQNSFNHALFLAIQRYLSKYGLPGTVRLVDAKNRSLSYGILLDPTNAFSTTHKVVADGLRFCNRRRNDLPESHPYGVSGAKTRWLQKKEQVAVFKALKLSYAEILKLVSKP